MQRFIFVMKSFLLAAVFGFCLLVSAQNASAEEYSEGFFKYTTDGKTITITSYFGTDAAVEIPESIASMPVTVIKAGAFSGNEVTKTLTIPEYVSQIEAGALLELKALQKVIVKNPNLVVEVSDYVVVVENYPQYIDVPDTPGNSADEPGTGDGEDQNGNTGDADLGNGAGTAGNSDAGTETTGNGNAGSSDIGTGTGTTGNSDTGTGTGTTGNSDTGTATTYINDGTGLDVAVTELEDEAVTEAAAEIAIETETDTIAEAHEEISPSGMTNQSSQAPLRIIILVILVLFVGAGAVLIIRKIR